MADPASVLAQVTADLSAESDAVDRLVASLDPDGWAAPTPAVGWTIAHQIGHLAWTDAIALTAATDPDGFGAALAAAASDPQGHVDRNAAEGAAGDPAELLARWRDGRARLAAALVALPPGSRLPWFGPPMSAASMATARLMETWAHGLDVADALGAPPSVSDRLRHVAHLGVRTRDFAYVVHGRTPPAGPFRIELTAPSGELWAWGPVDADQQVAGPALDFCFLVTQRRHRDDLALVAVGAEADAWLDIAQAFAGLPGSGRTPTATA